MHAGLKERLCSQLLCMQDYGRDCVGSYCACRTKGEIVQEAIVHAGLWERLCSQLLCMQDYGRDCAGRYCACRTMGEIVPAGLKEKMCRHEFLDLREFDTI